MEANYLCAYRYVNETKVYSGEVKIQRHSDFSILTGTGPIPAFQLRTFR